RPDLAPAFADVVAAFRALEPSRLEKLSHTAVTFEALARAAGADDASRALLEALYAADIDYEFFDVASPGGQRCGAPLVLYAGAEWASSLAQERMREYVESGGTLVFFQTLPLYADRPAPRAPSSPPPRGHVLGPPKADLSPSAPDAEGDPPDAGLSPLAPDA